MCLTPTNQSKSITKLKNFGTKTTMLLSLIYICVCVCVCVCVRTYVGIVKNICDVNWLIL